MKAKEIWQGLIAKTEGFDESYTCDTLKAGDPEREVTKIAVAMVATPDLIRETAAWGAELLIVHEPSYYNHMDKHSEEAVEVAKRKLLTDTGMVVYRYHDRPHYARPDEIAKGEMLSLALDGEVEYTNLPILTRVHLRTPMTPLQLAKHIEDRLGIRHVRICGARDLPCTEISAMFGATDITNELMRPETEILLSGETAEWINAEYARDAAQLGYRKALLILGHVGSERDGMKDICRTIQAMYPSLEVKYFDSGEVYTYTDSEV